MEVCAWVDHMCNSTVIDLCMVKEVYAFLRHPRDQLGAYIYKFLADTLSRFNGWLASTHVRCAP